MFSNLGLKSPKIDVYVDAFSFFLQPRPGFQGIHIKNEIPVYIIAVVFPKNTAWKVPFRGFQHVQNPTFFPLRTQPWLALREILGQGGQVSVSPQRKYCYYGAVCVLPMATL